MSVRCVVFDFDGTLADTFGVCLTLFNQLAILHGFKELSGADLQHARGLTAKEFSKFVGVSRWRMPRLLIKGKKMMRARINEIKACEGMPPLIEVLRKPLPGKTEEEVLVLGILTSNSEENVSAFLNRSGIKGLQFILSVPRLTGKQSRLRRIQKRYNFKPEEIVYIGDELRDIVASKKAGVQCLAASWGFNSKKSLLAAEPTAVVDSPEEILTWLQKNA